MRKFIYALLFLLLVTQIVRSDEPLPEYFQKYVDELVKQLGADDWPAREKATDQLIYLGPIIRPKIEAVLNHADAEVRLRAQYINFALRWKSAFATRIDNFVAQVRQGKIQDFNLLQQSLPFLSGDEASYLLLDLLKDQRQTLESRRQVAQALQNAYNVSFKPILPELIKLWQAEKDGAVRYSLLMSFARVGRDERLTPVLIEALKGTDYNNRIGAVSVLGQLHEETAIPELVKLLSAPDENTRNTAVYALNNFHTPQVFEELLAFWKKETTPWLKNQTITVLAGFQDKRFLPELTELVKTEKNPQVLNNVAFALPNFRGDPAVSGICLALLKAGDVTVRSNTLNVIRANNDRALIPELIKMLEAETDFSSFTTLLDVLQSLTGQKFFPQQIPPELKAQILQGAREWWTKNK